MRIGIDFDNTIACYDAVFAQAARHRNLIPASFPGGKSAVRAAVRSLPDGEAHWQGLQGWVYGAGMANAALIPGVGDFLNSARRLGHEVFIISHKTEYGHFDPLRVNLRDAALAWMEARGFFDPAGFGLARANVIFEATRDDKVARIAAVSPDWFIDDLEEVLTHPAFPPTVRRMLFGEAHGNAGLACRPDWPAIARKVLAHAD
ncbi:MAG TPA: hypothetical protein VGE72_01165 [Azospirillum sp.]